MQTTLINEIVYYGDGAVWVTSQRFVVGEKTYWLTDIDRAEVGRVPGEQWAGDAFPKERLDWGKLVPPSMLVVAMFKIGWDPVPLAIAASITVLISIFMWRGSASKPPMPVLQLAPVYVIKAEGKRLRHVMFASLDEGHTRNLADLINEAAQAQRRREPPNNVLHRASLEPPRGNATSPALATYFMDGLVWITSEVVHVGHESYPLHQVKAAYVHYGRIDWYTAEAAEGYFLILHIHDTLIPALATTDSEYAYKVRDAIKAALKRLGQNHLRRTR